MVSLLDDDQSSVGIPLLSGALLSACFEDGWSVADRVFRFPAHTWFDEGITGGGLGLAIRWSRGTCRFDVRHLRMQGADCRTRSPHDRRLRSLRFPAHGLVDDVELTVNDIDRMVLDRRASLEPAAGARR